MKLKRIVTPVLVICLLLSLFAMLASCNKTTADDPSISPGGSTSDDPNADESPAVASPDIDTGRPVDKEGTIVYGMAGSPNDTYNFYESTSTRSMITIDSIFDKLVFVDALGEIQPRAAETWEWADDGRTLTLHLNENYWHDGVPVTAEDWVWTLTMMCDPEVHAANISGKIENYLEGCSVDDGNELVKDEVGVKYIDEYTFSITLNDDYNTTSFMQTILSYAVVLPKHIFTNNDGSVQSDIDVFTNNPEYWAKPIGSGAAFIVEDSLDAYTKVQSWDKYHGYGEDGPQYKYIVWQYISADSQFGSKIVSGDLDMCYPGLTNEDVEYYTDNDNIKLYESATVVTQYDINFDCMLVPKYVRTAINYAIDKQFLLDSVCGGRGEVGGGSLVMPSYKYYVDGLGTEQDLDYARECLQKAIDDGDWAADRVFYLNVPSDLYETIANLVKSYCEQIGLQVEVMRRDSVPTIQENMFWASTEGYDAVLWSFAPTIDPTKVGGYIQYNTAVAINLFSRWGLTDGDLEDSLKYQEAYTAFTKAFVEEDQEKYAEQMQIAENEGFPCISLVNLREVYACSNYVGSVADQNGIADVTTVNYYNQDIWNWIKFAS